MTTQTTPSRAYTLAEIDRMRNAVSYLCTPSGIPYYAQEKNAEIEDRLRTYMMAGISPEDLDKEVGEMQRAEIELQERMRNAR